MISTYEFLATWLRARFSDTERGASLVEYALLVALIAVICIVRRAVPGRRGSNSFSSTGNAIELVRTQSNVRRGAGHRPAPPSRSGLGSAARSVGQRGSASRRHSSTHWSSR